MEKKETKKKEEKKSPKQVQKPISKAGLMYRKMQKNPVAVILDMEAVLK